MAKETDWYPATLEGERDMYGNIEAKIDGYAATFPAVLTNAYLAEIHTMCQAFIEGYDKTTQNRATSRQGTTWFTKLVRSKQKNKPADKAPAFQLIVMPADALEGIEEQCRAMARLLKSQADYDKGIGLDLMIEKEKGGALDLTNAAPELKITVNLDNSVTVEWKKTGFDMLELQYRKTGATMWQAADKSTEKSFTFAPPLTQDGVPEKFEFRAVYIVKNHRVGQWSQIVVITVG